MARRRVVRAKKRRRWKRQLAIGSVRFYLCLSDKLKAGMAAFWIWIRVKRTTALSLWWPVEKDAAKMHKGQTAGERVKGVEARGLQFSCREVMQEGKPVAF